MKSCSLVRNGTIRRPVNLARRGEPHTIQKRPERLWSWEALVQCVWIPLSSMDLPLIQCMAPTQISAALIHSVARMNLCLGNKLPSEVCFFQ